MKIMRQLIMLAGLAGLATMLNGCVVHEHSRGHHGHRHHNHSVRGAVVVPVPPPVVVVP